MNYIGIRGHRGSGKNTVSFLLGETIEFYLKHSYTFNGFDERWLELIDSINNCKESDNPCDWSDCSSVYFESFATTPKVFTSMLLGIDMDDIDDEYIKDHTWINLRNFNIYSIKDSEQCISYTDKCISIDDQEYPIYTASQMFERQLSLYKSAYEFEEGYVLDEDIFMTLREFVIYYGGYCSRFALGRNVWVKSIIANDGSRFASYYYPYKIYTDVKFPSEVSYIKDKKGIIINVIRNDHKKKNNNFTSSLEQDNRIDYTVDMSGNIYDKKEQFKNIVLQIVNRQ